MTWEFSNPSSLSIGLSNVTVNDSDGHLLWNNEVLDLSASLGEQRTETDALPTYGYQMTLASDNSVQYAIYLSVDGGASVEYQPASAFNPGDTATGAGFTNSSSVTSLKYTILFSA